MQIARVQGQLRMRIPQLNGPFEFAQRTRTTVQIKFTFDCCLECVDKYFRHSCTDDHVNLTDNETNQD